jgi:hypothetical protein
MVERSGWNSPFQTFKGLNKSDEKNMAFTPVSKVIKAIPNRLGCTNLVTQSTATPPWIHVWQAALAAFGEKLC